MPVRLQQGGSDGRADDAADAAAERPGSPHPAYQTNLYQVSQGGRNFAWYGCSGCHTDAAPGVLNLPDSQWRHGSGFAQVFGAIADRHGRLDFRSRVPTEQIWQLTAYVRDLPQHTPDKRRRLEADQKGEPVGPAWTGPR